MQLALGSKKRIKKAKKKKEKKKKGGDENSGGAPKVFHPKLGRISDEQGLDKELFKSTIISLLQMGDDMLLQNFRCYYQLLS